MARLIDADALNKFPIRLDHCDKEHGSEAFVFGIESVLEYAEYLQKKVKRLKERMEQNG